MNKMNKINPIGMAGMTFGQDVEMKEVRSYQDLGLGLFILVLLKAPVIIVRYNRSESFSSLF